MLDGAVPPTGGGLLAVSAHAADFVWRCGGALALAAAQSGGAHVICLSFGERGESARLWQQGLDLA
jgi:4-oxalomesaconate hydratase